MRKLPVVILSLDLLIVNTSVFLYTCIIKNCGQIENRKLKKKTKNLQKGGSETNLRDKIDKKKY